MTESEDHETRPIRVSELLARNGTIGAPIGGRRRRRRGNENAVTVAELTGEIPVVRTGENPVVRTGENPVVTSGEIPAIRQDVERDRPNRHARPSGNGTAEPAEALHDDELAGHPEDDGYDLHEYDDYLDSIRGPRPAGPRAEEMVPDSVGEADGHGGVELDEPAPADESEDLPSYLRSEHAPLFGGHTVADDLARRRSSGGSEDLLTEDHDEDAPAGAPQTTMSKVLRGGWIVLQSIIAVAFGAGLFLAFNQLWQWNRIVALVLSVLVILGLVVAVRLVRKTEDIGSTLIAVAVGALVTFGPLPLLHPL
jgi:hypothetical protein